MRAIREGDQPWSCCPLDKLRDARQSCGMGERKTLATVATLAFCAGVCISFFTLPVWVAFAINVAKEGQRTDWLGFAGNIVGSGITSAVAVAAIYFAWRGVTQQLRITLVSREEDRIEAELPGLRQAGEFLRSLEFLPDPDQILELMELKELIVEGAFEIEELKKLLPDLSERSMRPIFSILRRLMIRSQVFLQYKSSLDRLQKEMVNDLGMFPPDIIEQRKRMRDVQQRQLASQYDMLKQLLGEFDGITKGVELRLQTLTERQILFRQEIEQHFGPV